MERASPDFFAHSVDAGGLEQVFYIPEFVSEEEESYLLRQISNTPRPKWRNLANRRLQVWGGDLTSTGKLLAQPLPPFLNKYPDIIGRLRATGAFSSSTNGAPNHVIINEYHPNQGIMPHEDGPSYHPVVATISLGSYTVFHYYQYKPGSSVSPAGCGTSSLRSPVNHTPNSGSDEGQNLPAHSVKAELEKDRVIDTTRPVLSLMLEPRSLVITTGALYSDHLHGIDPRREDVFLPAGSSPEAPSPGASPDLNSDTQGVRVANWKLVKDAKIRETVMQGGVLKRDTRVSMTCRDVERVVGGKTLR
ncbi:hypothetical protein M0805_003586 [Coniferiporia weirii]|nr:hypothetical protein M0805_003586 [Coniferiporia weirii]